MSKRMKMIGAAALLIVLLLLLYIHSRGHREYVIDVDALHWNGGYLEGDHYVIDEKNERGVICYTNLMELNPGDYVIRVNYEQQFVENTIQIHYGDKIKEVPLPLDETVYEVPLTTDETHNRVMIEILYEKTGKLTITSVEVIGAKLFFTDMYFLMVMLLLGVCIVSVLWRKGVFDVSGQRKLAWLLLWGAIIISCLPFAEAGISSGDDTFWHMGRIDGIRDALRIGEFPARISPYEYNGYGMLQTMYPNGFLYLAALLRLCHVSAPMAYKVIMILGNVGAGLAASYAVVSVQRGQDGGIGSDKQAWCGAVAGAVYCLMPYRLLNIYSRSALGEVLAMIFWPLLFLGLYHLLIGDKKKWYWLAIAMTGMINTHIISFLLSFFICAGICLIWVKRLFSERRYLYGVRAALFTIALNAAYLVPFLYFYLGNYTGADMITYAGEPMKVMYLMTAGFKSFLAPMFGIAGLACLAMIIAGVCFREKAKNDNDWFLLTILLLGCICLFAATDLVPYEQLLKLPLFEALVKSIQFPWRLVGIATAATALLVGWVQAVNDGLYRYRYVLAVGLMVLLLPAIVPFFREGDLNRMDEFSRDNYQDYFPANASMAEKEMAETDIIDDTSLHVSDETAVSVKDYQRAGKDITFTYTSDTDGQYVDIPVFYYPGCFSAKDGGERALLMEESPEGRIRLRLRQAREPITVRVFYRDAPMFNIALWVSIFTLAACGVNFVWRKKNVKKNKQ